MKYIILIGDGMAGRPLKELDGKTTLEAAKTPAINKLLSRGKTGMVLNVPEGLPPGSDVASMSIFGYDPKSCYSGRGPLEAAAMGLKLADSDVAYRMNLVTIENEVMKDFTAGHISTEEAHKIVGTLKEKLKKDNINFYPGVSYRHLVVIHGGAENVACTPPHNITDKPINKYLPKGEGSNILNDIMIASRHVLSSIDTKATQAWIWGGGKKPQMQKITDKFNISGGIITAVDLLKGIGKYAGLKVINVDGATGFIDTNYQGKVEAALSVLHDSDLVIVHVEAPDECGHMGDIKLKIKAIEDFDKRIVKPIIDRMIKDNKAFRALVLPDHPTPIEIKTHSSDAVPFVYYDSDKDEKSDHKNYCEKAAEKTDIYIERGHTLLERFITGTI